MTKRGFYFMENIGLVPVETVRRRGDVLTVRVTRSAKRRPDKGTILYIEPLDFVRKIRGIINTAPIDTTDMINQ